MASKSTKRIRILLLLIVIAAVAAWWFNAKRVPVTEAPQPPIDRAALPSADEVVVKAITKDYEAAKKAKDATKMCEKAGILATITRNAGNTEAAKTWEETSKLDCAGIVKTPVSAAAPTAPAKAADTDKPQTKTKAE